MLRSSAQPQTEAEERAALIFECGMLSGHTHRLTGHLPRAIRVLAEREEGLDFATLTSAEIAALCDEIRAECPAAAEEAARA
jgi:hypothetical protein